MLSALQHWSYCPRQCALIHVEQAFAENVFTMRGNAAHERVDDPGFETFEGVRAERALPVWSERLGLNGKCDIVEAEWRSPSNLESQISALKVGNPASVDLKSQISDLKLGSAPSVSVL